MLEKNRGKIVYKEFFEEFNMPCTYNYQQIEQRDTNGDKWRDLEARIKIRNGEFKALNTVRTANLTLVHIN